LLEALGRRKTDDIYALPDAGAAATRENDTSLAMSGPLGYSPLPEAGSTGVLVFSKRTPHGDELRVIVDRGTWSHHFAARLEIRTEEWIRSMGIPLAANDLTARVYPLIDQEQIGRLCANLTAVIREAEATVYEQVRAAKNV
jgi:hypothetical protein